MVQNIRQDEPVVMEGAVARLPPRRFRVTEVLGLTRYSADQYRQDGVVYLVATDERGDWIERTRRN